MSDDKVIQKLLEHGERLSAIEQKLGAVLTQDEYLAGQDRVMTILQRLDQERIFTSEWVHRIEAEVERHSHELTKVKQQLKIA